MAHANSPRSRSVMVIGVIADLSQYRGHGFLRLPWAPMSCSPEGG